MFFSSNEVMREGTMSQIENSKSQNQEIHEAEFASDESYYSDSESSGFETFDELIKWMSKKKKYKIKRPTTENVNNIANHDNCVCQSQIEMPDDKELEEGMISIDV